MLGELELLVEATHQFVNKQFIVVCDDIPRTPYLKIKCVQIKSTMFSFSTSFKVIASALLEK